MGTHQSRPRGRAAAIALAVSLMLGSAALLGPLSAGAAAETVTVGSPLNAPFNSIGFGSPFTVIDIGLPEAGANEVSPITGTVVRWRVLQASGPMLLRVVT